MTRPETAGRPEEEGFQPATLAPYLADRFGCSRVIIRELIRFPRGSSRETWFLRCKLQGSKASSEEHLVIRRDFPGGSICPMPLAQEYEIYRRLACSDAPVAEVLWYETEPECVGSDRDFYVRRKVDGDWRIPHFQDPHPRYHRIRIAAAKEHLEKLARVHLCDWKALGFGQVFDVPKSPEDCVPQLIESIEKELASFQIEPFPMFLEMKEWLLDQAPPKPARISLLKGTNGYGEEVFENGRIVAMSDWELARIGDPAYDWAQMQDFAADLRVDGRLVWSLEHALEHYERISGIHVTPSAVVFYRQLLSLNILMFCHHSAIPVCEGRDLMARLCWPATEVVYRAQRTMAAALGLGRPAPRVPGQMG